jgi:hypothetical protein
MKQLIEFEEKIHAKSTVSLREYFIFSIEEMGYERTLIEKAVELYGYDTQQVLYYLLDQ